MRFLATLTLILTHHTTAQAAVISFVDDAGGDFRPSMISDLNISGTAYNVEFHYSTSFNDFAAAVSPGAAITFGNATDAENAAIAMANAINATGTNAPGTLAFDLLTPYELGTDVSYMDIFVQNNNPLTYTTLPSDDTISPTMVFGSDVAWAAYSLSSTSAAVPEPSGAFALLIAAVGFVVHQRRRLSPSHSTWCE